MNNAQDMSPDFVLMRLVSAAEDDRLDDENGNLASSGGVVAGLGQEVLGHGNLKGGFECSQNHSANIVRHSHLSSALNNAQQSGVGGTEAPDAGVMATRAGMSVPPPPHHHHHHHGSTEAQQPGFDFAHRGTMRPQLLVFRNISCDDVDAVVAEQHGSPDEKHPIRAHHIGDHDQSSGFASDSHSSSINNNTVSLDAQQQCARWSALPQIKSPTIAVDGTEGSELCHHRHGLITDKPDWSPLDTTNPLAMIESKWGCTATDSSAGTIQYPERSVFGLAKKFGKLGVAPVSELLFKDGEVPHCSCQSVLGSAASGIGQGDDPTETSDALLVLEGLGSEEVTQGLGIGSCSPGDAESQGKEMAFMQLQGNADLVVEKMSGAFALGCCPAAAVLAGQGDEATTCAKGSCSAACRDTQVCCCLIQNNSVSLRPQAGLGDTEQESSEHQPAAAPPPGGDHPPPPAQSRQDRTEQKASPARRSERSVSVPRIRASRGGTSASSSSSSGATDNKAAPGKSRSGKGGSLKFRLSKLFRTKSCSGSSHLLDKRPSVTYSVSSAGSLVDMSRATGRTEPDTSSQPTLTRAQSTFSAASFSPSFTGETVSLVDVDISRRGVNSPHPPTPPPPPRRSLSLLDAFLRVLPHHGAGPSSDAAHLAPRVAGPPPPLLCPLRRPDSATFTASLRELERCGWYWGPMNWEDAEMKLKGKPDGSFLVRDSSDPRYILSLSFRSQGVTHHTRMEHYRGTFSLWCHPKFEDRCHSVVEFIERAIMHSKNGKFLYFLRSRVPGLPPTPVQLLYPVSRFSNVKSLQHLCRFCVRQMVRIDHIQQLPLPKPLIAYLSKFYYYDPEEEMYLSVRGIRRAMGVQEQEQEAADPQT
ncbi:suppressor of cytokine signaling 7 [Engraulis encrasicolus]|uniref:suppressor of cytokine signaling 7 n=1 Tax=Engraulis encrasicolus TaxID=184585 RepID=UPI002FD51D13